MAAPKKEGRDSQLIEDYQGGRPVSEICRAYNLSERRVFQILKTYGIKAEAPVMRKGTPKSLSRMHERLGLKVYNFYFDQGWSRSEAAARLGCSPQKLRLIELGAHDVTLLDLQDLMAFTQLTASEIFHD